MEHDGHTNKRHPLTQYLSLQTVTYIFHLAQNPILLISNPVKTRVVFKDFGFPSPQKVQFNITGVTLIRIMRY